MTETLADHRLDFARGNRADDDAGLYGSMEKQSDRQRISDNITDKT